VQLYLNPEAKHYLDWFHITMRLTVMGQYAKGLDTTQEKREEILKSLESVKHYLWHGNVVRARDKLEDLHGILDHEGIAGENGQKLRKALDEFDRYIAVNQPLIANYGERWRNEEAIATGFVESAVNQIVSKRFSKKQQMQWTKKSAHLVLQMRTQVLDERLEDTFRDWYPDFRTKPPEDEIKQAV
jgi:6-phosphogluconate dehydrogenase (decarboxylating)